MEKIYKKVINVKQLSENANVPYGKVNDAFSFDSAARLKEHEKSALLSEAVDAVDALKTFLK